jgi:hypothetical protein
MWEQPLGIDMRGKHHSTRASASVTATTSELLVAVGLLGGMFALLLAASYPVVAAAVLAGAVSVTVYRAGMDRLTRPGGVCVPGTDRCLRPAP